MAQKIEDEHVDSLSSHDEKLQVKNFIWCEEEWPLINHNNFADKEDIPVISLLRLLEAKKVSEEYYTKVCHDMVKASQKWGFFKLINHGVSNEIIKNVKVELNDFFDLPMEEKLKGVKSETLPLGYSASNPEYGMNLPWAEIIQLLQSPQQVYGFASKVLGDEHYVFSNALIEYMEALNKLGMTIFAMLAHGLGLPRDFFTKNFEEKESTMIRINRYPVCPLPEMCLGLGSHSDPHTLTILLQDEVGGLQVLKDDGQWIGIRPVPNSFVVNIGDTLEAWTNGMLKSVVHRAVVNKEKKRLSVAYFMSPKSTALIQSPAHLVDPDTRPRKYGPFTWGDFRKQLLIQKRVKGKTALDRYLISH